MYTDESPKEGSARFASAGGGEQELWHRASLEPSVGNDVWRVFIMAERDFMPSERLMK